MSTNPSESRTPATRVCGEIVRFENGRFVVRRDDDEQEVLARPGRGLGCIFGPHRLVGRRALVSIRARSPGFGTLLRLFPAEPESPPPSSGVVDEESA